MTRVISPAATPPQQVWGTIKKNPPANTVCELPAWTESNKKKGDSVYVWKKEERNRVGENIWL